MLLAGGTGVTPPIHNCDVVLRAANTPAARQPIRRYLPDYILPCKDGWLGICIVQSFWEAFAKWLNPGWLEDPRFADTVSRAEHAGALDSEIARAIASRNKHDLEREGQLVIRVPCGAVNTPAELLSDGHLNDRQFWKHDFIEDREVVVPGLPFRFLEDSVGVEPPPESVQRPL